MPFPAHIEPAVGEAKVSTYWPTSPGEPPRSCHLLQPGTHRNAICWCSGLAGHVQRFSRGVCERSKLRPPQQPVMSLPWLGFTSFLVRPGGQSLLLTSSCASSAALCSSLFTLPVVSPETGFSLRALQFGLPGSHLSTFDEGSSPVSALPDCAKAVRLVAEKRAAAKAADTASFIFNSVGLFPAPIFSEWLAAKNRRRFEMFQSTAIAGDRGTAGTEDRHPRQLPSQNCLHWHRLSTKYLSLAKPAPDRAHRTGGTGVIGRSCSFGSMGGMGSGAGAGPFPGLSPGSGSRPGAGIGSSSSCRGSCCVIQTGANSANRLLTNSFNDRILVLSKMLAAKINREASSLSLPSKKPVRSACSEARP